MGYSSRKDSKGSQGLFGRLIPKLTKSDASDARERGSDSDVGFASMFKKTQNVRNEMPAVKRDRDIGTFGYDTYEVSDDCSIYISSKTENAIFEDDEYLSELPSDGIVAEPVFEPAPEAKQADEEQTTFEDTFEDMFENQAETTGPTEISIEDLFGNVKRGSDGAVDTAIGVFDNGEFMKVDRSENVPFTTMDSFTEPEPAAEDCMMDSLEIEESHAETAIRAVDVYEDIESTIMVMPVEDSLGEVERIGAYTGPDKDDVPEVFVPKVEDFTEEAATEQTAEEPIERIGSYKPKVEETMQIPYDLPAFVATAFCAFIDSVPEYESAPVQEMRIMEAPVEMIPAFVPTAEEPEWDVTDEASVSFTEFMADMPEYPAIVAVPAWDVTDEAADAYAAFGTIMPEYPEEVKEAPAWEVSEDAAEAFEAFNSIEPEYPEVSYEMPAWDVTEEAAFMFGAFVSIEPEYPEEVKQAPVWDVSDEAAAAYEAFGTIMPEYPEEVKEAPAWEVSEEAVSAYAGFQSLEDEYFMQAFTATLPSTIASGSIVVPPMEERVTDDEAIPMGMTGNTAKTTTKVDEIKVDFVNDPSFNKDNTEVRPEPRIQNGCVVRPSRYVFKDGRLQKVSAEPVEASRIETPADQQINMDYKPAPAVAEEPFRAPLTVEEDKHEPEMAIRPRAAKLVAKQVEGVNFSFGQSNTGNGSVRFSF